MASAEITVLVALVAAAPPTLAAFAALLKATKTDNKLSVSNGHAPGFMIEKTYDLVHEVDKKLDIHINNQEAHCQEAHSHHEKG